MTNSQAKTIQIFLPTGEPRGIRIAEFTIRTVQAVLIPRSELSEAKVRSELDQIAVYFLFGDSEESAKPIVYVGQTEDVRKRLDNHNTKKDFWRTAVLRISRTQNFTQAHIRYLEWYCVKKAKEIGRYALDNDQNPSKPFVTEPIEADILDAFDTLSTLLSTLGYPGQRLLLTRADGRGCELWLWQVATHYSAADGTHTISSSCRAMTHLSAYAGWLHTTLRSRPTLAGSSNFVRLTSSYLSGDSLAITRSPFSPKMKKRSPFLVTNVAPSLGPRCSPSRPFTGLDAPQRRSPVATRMARKIPLPSMP